MALHTKVLGVLSVYDFSWQRINFRIRSDQIISDRTVGAALRGRPWVKYVFANPSRPRREPVCKPRAATEGRPYQYVPRSCLIQKLRFFFKILVWLSTLFCTFARKNV